MKSRIAVFASGGGSNLQAILEFLAGRGAQAEAEVVVVASDRAEAGALERARAAGIATSLIASPRAPHQPEALAVMREHDVDFVALAGFLQLLPPELLAEFPSRIVNIHPALLPAFGGAGMYGARVHRAVLASGARVSGATVHYVDEEYDHGAVLAQWPVPVLADDTVQSLAARVLKVEHVLYPRVVEAVASGRWRFHSRPRAVPDAGCG